MLYISSSAYIRLSSFFDYNHHRILISNYKRENYVFKAAAYINAYLVDLLSGGVEIIFENKEAKKIDKTAYSC